MVKNNVKNEEYRLWQTLLQLPVNNLLCDNPTITVFTHVTHQMIINHLPSLKDTALLMYFSTSNTRNMVTGLESWGGASGQGNTAMWWGYGDQAHGLGGQSPKTRVSCCVRVISTLSGDMQILSSFCGKYEDEAAINVYSCFITLLIMLYKIAVSIPIYLHVLLSVTLTLPLSTALPDMHDSIVFFFTISDLNLIHQSEKLNILSRFEFSPFHL